MEHAQTLMFRCPQTGRELSTAVEMDPATFEQLRVVRSQIRCPICNVDHLLPPIEGQNGAGRRLWHEGPQASQLNSMLDPVFRPVIHKPIDAAARWLAGMD